MSKTLEFTKMHGCGNDYIYFDCFDGEPEDPEELSRILSDRHFSIGGDGIILVCKSDKADGKMRIFNADGSEAMMCGNGVRCVGKFLHDIKGIDKDVITVDTLSGVKILQMFTDDNDQATGAEVDMGKAILEPKEIPVDLPADESGEVMNRDVDISGESYKISCVSMGNPHCVVFGGDPDQLDLPVIGPKFENDPIFPNRVNTEFIKVIDDHTLKMRVWERGSGETLACGTGACASVVAAVRNGYCQENEYVKVILKGGELEIRYMDDGEVFMKGPAEIAFTGSVEVDL
ncbi:MAG: diaminopimelate epimerase [Eubacteriales bacterium]|nr:diaminopimelate epimerase [Eubacteriales bacterium]